MTRSSIAPVTTVRVVLAGAGSEQPKRAETDHRNTGCDICTAIAVAVHQHMEMHYITAEHRVVQLIIARAAGTGGGQGGLPHPYKSVWWPPSDFVGPGADPGFRRGGGGSYRNLG